MNNKDINELYKATMDNVTMPRMTKTISGQSLPNRLKPADLVTDSPASANMPPSPLPCAQFFCASRRQEQPSQQP